MSKQKIYAKNTSTEEESSNDLESIKEELSKIDTNHTTPIKKKVMKKGGEKKEEEKSPVSKTKEKEPGKTSLLDKIKSKSPTDFQDNLKSEIPPPPPSTEMEHPIDSKIKDFGWKNLGHSRIHYDDELKEYVYQVSEPELTEKEAEFKEKLTYLFKITTISDVDEIRKDKRTLQLVHALDELINAYKLPIDEGTRDKIYYYIIQEFVGYGRIDIPINDEGIEDISCDGKGVPIFIYHQEYESIRTNIMYPTDEELDDFITKLSQICEKQISMYEPIVDGKLPDGSRLQGTLSKTVTTSSTFTIRRFRDRPLTPLDLIRSNTMSADMVSYFWLIMEYGSSILFCGGTAAGKTTALNALSLFIPPAFKIVSIEDTREINLPHENWIAGTTRTGFGTTDQDKTGKDIDMYDLIRAALRQRPKVIIVGEVRGKEAYTLFQAMATGHLSYSTMHANDIQTLIQRLESPPIDLPRSLLTSLDVIAFLKAIKTVEGSVSRRMTSAVEIIKQDPNSGKLISVTPFTWNSALDDTFRYVGGSVILEKIRTEWGWTADQLNEELERRKVILSWMQKQGIDNYQDFGNIIAEYKKDPQSVYGRIIADAQ